MQTKFRKNVRLKEYNYIMDGYYFVTIVTRDRLPKLEPYKDGIESIIKNLPQFINGLSIDYFKVTDNHIHIIFVFKNCTRPLGRVVSVMKYGITKIVKNEISAHEKVNDNSPDAKQGSGGITIPQKKLDGNSLAIINMANSNSPATKETIWQWNYYEHIIRNEKSLQKIREYIDNNPLVEMIKWENLDVSVQCSDKWRSDVVVNM